MFDLHDRLRAGLLGLKGVRARPLGPDEGFFYTAEGGTPSLFCSLSDPGASSNQTRYRFVRVAGLEGLAGACVPGWPGWMQVIDPGSDAEEALWNCLHGAYQGAVAQGLAQRPPSNLYRGDHVAHPSA